MVRKREYLPSEDISDIPVPPSHRHPMSGEPIWDQDAVRAAMRAELDAMTAHAKYLAEEGAKLAADAARYRGLESRVRIEGRDGGWTATYEFYPVPAWDDTPYSAARGEGFHHKTLDDAVDALLSAKRKAP